MLPKGWAEVDLGQIADFIMGQAPPGEECNIDGDGTPFVKAGEFGSERPIIREWTTRPLKMAQESDVFICVVGATAGKINLGADCAIGRSVAAIRPSNATAADFLYPRLRSEIHRLRGASTGTAQGVISREMLALIPIALPPIPEQRRIVAKLDALTARLTRARSELDRMPRLVHKLRTCALATAFDNSFPVKHLNELSTFITSGSRGWAQFYSESGPAFIRVGDVRRGDVHLDTSELQRVQPPIGAEGNRTAAQPGDLVVTITADLGRVGIVPKTLGPAFVNQHVALVRLTDQTNAKWIAWYLCSEDGQRQLLSKDRGVTKAGLGLDDIRNVLIPIADAEDQEKIVKGIEAAFARADRLEAKAARSKKLLDRLESTILTKAFKGELVPQDPNDEPATQLLDRIRAQRVATAAAKFVHCGKAAKPYPSRGRPKTLV